MLANSNCCHLRGTISTSLVYAKVSPVLVSTPIPVAILHRKRQTLISFELPFHCVLSIWKFHSFAQIRHSDVDSVRSQAETQSEKVTVMTV